MSLPTLKKGSKGKAVKVWQAIIGASIDGIFGSNTEALTRTFQSSKGLEVDGIVGTQSWSAGLKSL
jgi:peptidoglycan hydrolase-like protein with peptidoglycan-binding domain